MTRRQYMSGVTDLFRLRGPLAADPTASMLNLMLWALALWFGIAGLILLPYHMKDWFWTMQNQFVTDAALIAAIVLLQRGRYRAACFTYLGSIWFFATHVMALNGGIRSNVQALYVTLPISAAWLLGYSAAFWVGGVCMGCTLIFAILEVAGVILPRKIPGTPFGAWAVFGMASFIGALPVAQILRDLRSALIRSHKAEEASERAMQRLRTEIEEHERTEHALSESEERFRIMADTAPVMIVVSDAYQNVTFVNKGWLSFTGRKFEEALGAGWSEGIHPGDLESCFSELGAGFRERREYRLNLRFRRADGLYRLLLCHGVPRFDSNGSFAGYIASWVDITELKRAQEEALARQKWESLGVLAGGIAHDFNNLLGSLSAQSELLSQELLDASALETLATIQSVARRASEIVRQLMIYAGQESGVVEQVDLAAAAQEMLSIVHLSARKNATFDVDLPNGLPPIQANAAQIRQVLLNLFTNALEALEGREGVVAVKLAAVCRSGDDYIRVEVSDTGRGMSDEIQARIFDPFFTTKGPGRGLGLAAVQGIVRSHGGHISLESIPGRGSRFEILLPCTIALEQGPTYGGTLDLRESSPATVLLIEDEELLRTAVVKLLDARGLRVLEAGDGRTALELARSIGPNIDVALLDVTLPGLSSSEVLQGLQKILPAERIIITSAYGKHQAFAIVEADSRQAYIRKPYRVEELLRAIRQARIAGRLPAPPQSADSNPRPIVTNG